MKPALSTDRPTVLERVLDVFLAFVIAIVLAASTAEWWST